MFFNIAGKNYLFLFPSKTHKKFPSQEDKIGWFPSQLQSEEPASRKSAVFYIVVTMGVAKGHKSTLQWGGGGGNLLFKVFPIINSKTNRSAVTNFPVSSSEHLLFCQPARFLWGTDKVRNRFVGCPLNHDACKLICFNRVLNTCFKYNFGSTSIRFSVPSTITKIIKA